MPFHHPGMSVAVILTYASHTTRLSLCSNSTQPHPHINAQPTSGRPRKTLSAHDRCCLGRHSSPTLSVIMPTTVSPQSKQNDISRPLQLADTEIPSIPGTLSKHGNSSGRTPMIPLYSSLTCPFSSSTSRTPNHSLPTPILPLRALCQTEHSPNTDSKPEWSVNPDSSASVHRQHSHATTLIKGDTCSADTVYHYLLSCSANDGKSDLLRKKQNSQGTNDGTGGYLLSFLVSEKVNTHLVVKKA